MDAGICRTSSGEFCKKGLKKGGICSQHGGTPSPKKSSPRTPPRTPPRSPKRSVSPKKGMLDLPCDVLLEIAKNLDPQDYLTMSLVSKKIDMCLSEGKYDTLKEKAMLKQIQKDFLQIERLNRRKYLEPTFLSLSNPSLKVQEYVIRQDPGLILHIKDPNPVIEEIAIRLNPRLIFYLKNPRQESWEIYKEWFNTTILPDKTVIDKIKTWWADIGKNKAEFYGRGPAPSAFRMHGSKNILLGAYLRMNNKEWQKKTEEEKLPFIYFMWDEYVYMTYMNAVTFKPEVFHITEEIWDKYIEYTKSISVETKM